MIRLLIAQNPPRETPIEEALLLKKLGIVHHTIMANSIIAAGSVRDLLEVLNQYYVLDLTKAYDFVIAYFCAYLTKHPQKIVPVTNLKRLFHSLKKKGLKIGLVTNDSRLPTITICDLLEIQQSFDFIVTSDDFPSKPDATSLEFFSRQYGISLDEVFYVGDSLIDMQYARHCGGGIAVLTGGVPRQVFQDQASLILSSIEALPEYLVEEDGCVRNTYD